MKIEVKNLYYKYDSYLKESKFVLNDCSFSLDDNEFLAIIGETGSGKSTLAMHLNGLYRASSGAIYIDNKNIYDKDFDLNNLKFKVGIVFQYPEYQLFAETILDDVMFGALNKGLSKEEARQKAIDILFMFGFKEQDFNKMPFMLSGGEKRKVAIAGILIMEPDVLILDEPEAGLDPISKNELFGFFKKLHKQGKTIIFITHNLEDCCEYANKVLVMKEGRAIICDETYKVFNDNKILNDANIIKPDQLLLVEKLNNKNYNIDEKIIKSDDIINEIIKNRND